MYRAPYGTTPRLHHTEQAAYADFDLFRKIWYGGICWGLCFIPLEQSNNANGAVKQEFQVPER